MWLWWLRFQKKIRVDKDWVLDSGVTYHLTENASKAGEVVPFIGHGYVIMGNDSELCIHNIGTSTIECCDKELLLKNILHSYQASFNLFFVHKLCVDNLILYLKRTIFQGREGWLYRLNELQESSTVHSLFS